MSANLNLIKVKRGGLSSHHFGALAFLCNSCLVFHKSVVQGVTKGAEMSSYKEDQQLVDELCQLEGLVKNEYSDHEGTAIIQTNITNEELRLIQNKYRATSDLTIVRGPTMNTITITGLKDQVQVNQQELLDDVRVWDHMAMYTQMV